MCGKAVEDNPWSLAYVPDHFKTKRMCEGAIEDDLNTLEFVPDWFVTREWMWMWYGGYYDDCH